MRPAFQVEFDENGATYRVWRRRGQSAGKAGRRQPAETASGAVGGRSGSARWVTLLKGLAPRGGRQAYS